jgi:hypothetical protein
VGERPTVLRQERGPKLPGEPEGACIFGLTARLCICKRQGALNYTTCMLIRGMFTSGGSIQKMYARIAYLS